MHLPAETSTFVPAPAGNHRAVCIQVIDLGTHMESYMGGPAKPKRKVRLVWELTDEMMEDGKPFTIGQIYTLSSATNAKFREHLEAWRGRKFEATDFGPGGFEPKKLIGVPCLLNVTHNVKADKTYANIENVAPLPKTMAKPAVVNPTIYFSMDEPKWDGVAYGNVPDYWRKRIDESPEAKHWASHSGPPANDRAPPQVDDDDIPF